MNASRNTELRAASVSEQSKAAIESVFGQEQMHQVRMYEDIPTGLIRNGNLWISPGLSQRLIIYGDLTEQQISEIIDALRIKLLPDRDDSFAPIVVEFYQAEKFNTQQDGTSTRAGEILLRREVLTPRT